MSVEHCTYRKGTNKRHMDVVTLLVVLKHLPYDVTLSARPNGYVADVDVLAIRCIGESL